MQWSGEQRVEANVEGQRYRQRARGKRVDAGADMALHCLNINDKIQGGHHRSPLGIACFRQ